MKYRLIRDDELYHHGVKGMKWGVRRQTATVGRQRSTSDGRYSSEQRKAQVKKAFKIGAAVAATAVVAYGGYKVYKLHGDAITSLGKKYVEMGNTHLQIARNREETAFEVGTEANRIRNQADTARNSHDRSIYSESAKALRSIADERYKSAGQSRDTAMQYYRKAAGKKYSKKEVAREMRDLAKNRNGNSRYKYGEGIIRRTPANGTRLVANGQRGNKAEAAYQRTFLYQKQLDAARRAGDLDSVSKYRKLRDDAFSKTGHIIETERYTTDRFNTAANRTYKPVKKLKRGY